MRDAVIVGAVRSAVGKRNGRLSPVRPDDLAAHVIRELVARVGIDASEVEDVILGCVDQLVIVATRKVARPEKID